MSQEHRYRAPFDRETEAVAWVAPDGRTFLVCGTESGFALRSPEEWESDDTVDFEADVQGNVFYDGQRVGWRIPAAVLRRAS